VSSTADDVEQRVVPALTSSEQRYVETKLATEARSSDVRLIQSVDRALLLMETLAGQDKPVLLSELARAADLNVSTCHHLLATLVARGYVLHAGRGRGYTLGSKLRELSDMTNRELDLLDFVQADLQRLNVDLRESVQMAVMRGTSLITQIRYGSMMPTHIEPDEVKKMRAAHATATGKAILAWLPEAEMARVVSENGLSAFTENTITTISGLIEELRLVRRSGFAIDEEELQENVICYGAALRDGSGRVIGSISCSIPKNRATSDYRSHIARSVVRCAQELSNRLRVSR